MDSFWVSVVVLCGFRALDWDLIGIYLGSTDVSAIEKQNVRLSRSSGAEEGRIHCRLSCIGKLIERLPFITETSNAREGNHEQFQ